MAKQKFIVEICPFEGRASACWPNGTRIRQTSQLGEDLADCCKSGDCQDACEYVIAAYAIEWSIVRKVGETPQGVWQYERGVATGEELQKTCETIYFESESDFSDWNTAAMYLIWQAASDLQEDWCELELAKERG